MPLSPYCFQVRLHSSSGFSETPIGVMTRLIDGGSGFPANSLTIGFGSNVSIELQAPSMNRKITFFARPPK